MFVWFTSDRESSLAAHLHLTFDNSNTEKLNMMGEHTGDGHMASSLSTRILKVDLLFSIH